MSSYDYAPVLKLKMGEVTALHGLKVDQKTRMLPVLEVVFSSPRKSAGKERDAKLASIINKFLTQKLPEFPDWLKQAQGEHPFILDFTLIYVDSVRETAIEQLLDGCAKNKQNVIVSVNVGDADEYKTLVYGYLKKHKFGLCIRVSRPDLKDIAKLDRELASIARNSGMGMSEIDLLVDIKEESDDQKYTQYFKASQKISSINQWRNLIFANGAFPESMGGLKSGKEHDLPRTDWIRFNSAISGKDIKRRPVYSDYSVRYPIYDPESEKHSPSPTIKYTTENNWRIMKGGGYDYGHYFAFSLALVSGTTYYSEKHCEGDRRIKEKADKCPEFLSKRAKNSEDLRAKGAGSSEEWISIGVSHHTVVTLDQLANRA